MTTDTRTRLLAEAEHLIRRVGYSAFSYADLAASIGIRKASIHHHFPCKQDLGDAVADAAMARFQERLAAIERDESGAVARLRAYGEIFLDGFEDGLRPICCALSAELAALPPSMHEKTRAYFDLHLAWLGRVVGTGIERGEIRWRGEAAALAGLILATLEGGSLLGRVRQSEDEVAAGFRQVLELIAPENTPG